MLVLSRKSTEKISIGDNIVIEVRRIAGNRVTLAIDAPRDIRILRGELESAAREFEATVDEIAAEEVAEEPTYAICHHRAPLSQISTTSAVG